MPRKPRTPEIAADAPASHRTFATNLMRLLKAHDLSARDLERLLKERGGRAVTRTTIGDYLQGRSIPAGDVLMSIADILNADMEGLLTPIPKKRKPLAPDHPQKRKPAKMRAARKPKDFPRPMGVPCASDGTYDIGHHEAPPAEAYPYQYPTPWRMRVSVVLHWLAARLANLSGWLDRTAARIRWR